LIDKKEKLLKSKDLTKWGYLEEGGLKELTKKQDVLV
jgi:hypothetical protein